MQTFEFQRLAALLRKRRYLIVIVAFAVVLVSAAGTWWAFFRQNNNPVPVSDGEDPCMTDSGGLRNGYAKTIVLCTMEAPKCKPDQTRMFRAHPPGGWNTEAMLVADVPDGYVITGGDLIDPSVYNLRSLGFDGVRITNYTNSNDYCTQHYWYYLRAIGFLRTHLIESPSQPAYIMTSGRELRRPTLVRSRSDPAGRQGLVANGLTAAPTRRRDARRRCRQFSRGARRGRERSGGGFRSAFDRRRRVASAPKLQNGGSPGPIA